MADQLTPEQAARDLLEQYGLDDAQAMTSGDVVELANFINHAWAWRREHGRCPHGLRPDDGCSRCETVWVGVLGEDQP